LRLRSPGKREQFATSKVRSGSEGTLPRSLNAAPSSASARRPVPASPANNGYKPGFAAALASGATTPLGAEAAQLYALFNANE